MKLQLLPSLFLATTLALVGCAGAAGPRAGATSTPATTQPVPSPALVTSVPSLPAPPVERSPVPAEDPLDLARQTAVSDLTDRLGVSPDQIEIVTAGPVSWPDSSLGCPQPDTTYTQAMVEGYRVILSHGSRIYLYHAGGDAVPALCHSGEKDGGHDFVPPPGFDE